MAVSELKPQEQLQQERKYANLMYRFFRSLLFILSPERAHYVSVSLIKLVLAVPFLKYLLKSKADDPSLNRTLFGLNFSNPIGLAAGFDKDARCFQQMGSLGFGFVEIGTVTPLPQAGNPKPRLFRLKSDQAIINRMGFNNEGVISAAKRLASRDSSSRLIIGGNIGKNKWTPNEKATQDYLKAFTELYPHVDYFAVNVSSPNTENLRALQDKEPLLNLLSALKNLNLELGSPKPILLKIAPDLSNEQLDDIVEIARILPLDGIIATNTTISRNGLKASSEIISSIGAGGLSGKPITARATEVIRYLHNQLREDIPIIGVGGIHSKEDALEKLAAGASLVQLYTGFIYEGPALIADIKKALIKRA
jgi:dihydroorotate dehydrogenase